MFTDILTAVTSRHYDVDPTRRPWRANLRETVKICIVACHVMTQHSDVSEEPASYPQRGGGGAEDSPILRQTQPVSMFFTDTDLTVNSWVVKLTTSSITQGSA